MQRRFSFTVEVPDYIPAEIVEVALEYVGQNAAEEFLQLMDAYDAGKRNVAAEIKAAAVNVIRGGLRRQ